MNIKNFEFKARVKEAAIYESKLLMLNPRFHGTDYQRDTYFNVPSGRLKLREGNIENALIFYSRQNIAGAKSSDVILYKHVPDEALKNILTLQFGIKAVVKKQRKIYFIDNVKFHFDTVDELGTFIEVEAADHSGKYTEKELQEQCNYYFRFFELNDSHCVDVSYSDMLEKG